MFFAPQTLPALPRLDFDGCRPLPPAALERLAAALAQRAELQRAAAGAQRMDAGAVAEMLARLGFSLELLELCVREGLAPAAPAYPAFLSGGAALLPPAGAEPALTADLLYCRYLAVLAALQAAQPDCAALRRAIPQLGAHAQVAKSAVDKLLPPLVRLRRMNAQREAVFAGLGAAERLFELNHATCDALERLLRVNFASVLALKTLAGPLNPDKAVFLAQLARRTQLLAEALAAFFAARAPAPAAFCALSARFFYLLALYALLRCNLYENEGLLRRSKDYKAIVCENSALAAEMRRVARQPCADAESARAFAAVFETFMAAQAEESARDFGYLREELAGLPAADAARAVDGIALTHDFIEDILAQQT